MTDIDRIAEAICSTTSAGKLFPWSESTEPEREPWRRMADAAIAAHLEALKADGYAVIKLPEPTAEDDDGQVFFGEYDIRADPTGSPGYRTVTTDFGMGTEFKVQWSPASARWWGKHLLAAADATEVPDE